MFGDTSFVKSVVCLWSPECFVGTEAWDGNSFPREKQQLWRSCSYTLRTIWQHAYGESRPGSKKSHMKRGSQNSNPAEITTQTSLGDKAF
eukprot:769272-Amphidinium_carterae.1